MRNAGNVLASMTRGDKGRAAFDVISEIARHQDRTKISVIRAALRLYCREFYPDLLDMLDPKEEQ